MHTQAALSKLSEREEEGEGEEGGGGRGWRREREQGKGEYLEVGGHNGERGELEE